MCNIEEDKFIFNNISYKKIKDKNLLDDFKNNIKDCYHISKRFYVINCNTYSKFLTIIRQVCSYNNIGYESKVIYERSKYIRVYYINKMIKEA